MEDLSAVGIVLRPLSRPVIRSFPSPGSRTVVFTASEVHAGDSISLERNRYADLLRVLSSGVVVYAHWLLVAITYTSGHLSGVDSMNYISWGPWATLVFQIMPVFFLV